MRVVPCAARGAGGWRVLALCALCAFFCAACAPAAGAPGATPPAAPAEPLAAATPVRQIAAAPTATSAPTPAPTLPPPTATPAGPPLVGLQVGHWKIEEHADELAKLRAFSGAYYGGYDEWEVNMIVAEAVRERLEAAGVRVELLPARIPIGYKADAFLSIHFDGVSGEEAATRRGWKVATPFRASAASQGLAAALEAVYPAVTGLPTDREEASFNLRAYYAFASYRYWHSIAPTTPAAIIECAFMTHPADRELIFERSDLIADGIAQGLLDYLAAFYPLSDEARQPIGRDLLRPAAEAVPLFARASEDSATLLTLGPADRLAPMAEEDGWVLAFTHGGEWELGWVRAGDLVATGEELAPPHPRP